MVIDETRPKASAYKPPLEDPQTCQTSSKDWPVHLLSKKLGSNAVQSAASGTVEPGTKRQFCGKSTSGQPIVRAPIGRLEHRRNLMVPPVWNQAYGRTRPTCWHYRWTIEMGQTCPLPSGGVQP